MTSRHCKSLLAVSLLVGALGRAEATELAGGRLQRLRPPALLQCSRDHLTSFQGRILEYQRSKQDLSLRVRTDEETTERFALKWDAADKAETWFLLRGEAFKSEDWKQIESAPGKLLDGMRVLVWVCDDGTRPVFDWRPKEG